MSASKVAWLILQRPETLSDEQQALLALLEKQSELSSMLKLAQGFIEIVRKRLPESLDAWIEEAEGSTIAALRSFARGLLDDYDAVKAGVTLEVSNGQVEGQNNRLKMLKRQMFGRAGLELLAKRLILSH